jgi:hypothetical protein
MYENRTVNPVEIVLRKGEGGWWGMVEGVNLIGVHHMHVWKYHSETSLKNYIC